MAPVTIPAFIGRLAARDDAELYVRFRAADLDRVHLEHGAPVSLSVAGRTTIRGIVKRSGSSPWLAPRDDSSNAEISAQITRAGFKLGEEIEAIVDIDPIPLAHRTTDIGYVNRNQQRVLRATGLPGNDHLQAIYVLRCEIDDCGNEYGANGSDIFQRRCPRCQGGAPGLSY